jgi:uncharacterized protein YegL
MPSIDDILEQHTATGTNFKFSATRIDQLGAAEYTLVTIKVDNSGSVRSFAQELQDTLKEVIKSCAKSPRADNLMIRVVRFDTRVEEFHGFKLLQDCNLGDYDNLLNPTGTTSLYDADLNAVGATSAYAEKLVDSDFKVNAVEFTLTDGEDVGSTFTAAKVKQAREDAARAEKLESANYILLGVNAGFCANYLANYKTQAGFDQFEKTGVSADELAKLAQFVSKSISATSQSLGTGSKSQALTF